MRNQTRNEVFFLKISQRIFEKGTQADSVLSPESSLRPWIHNGVELFGEEVGGDIVFRRILFSTHEGVFILKPKTGFHCISFSEFQQRPIQWNLVRSRVEKDLRALLLDVSD